MLYFQKHRQCRKALSPIRIPKTALLTKGNQFLQQISDKHLFVILFGSPSNSDNNSHNFHASAHVFFFPSILTLICPLSVCYCMLSPTFLLLFPPLLIWSCGQATLFMNVFIRQISPSAVFLPTAEHGVSNQSDEDHLLSISIHFFQPPPSNL